MFIDVSCPKCKSSLRVSEDFAGKNIRCNTCKAVFKVPEDVPFAEEVTTGKVTDARPKRRKPGVREDEDSFETKDFRRRLRNFGRALGLIIMFIAIASYFWPRFHALEQKQRALENGSDKPRAVPVQGGWKVVRPFDAAPPAVGANNVVPQQPPPQKVIPQPPPPIGIAQPQQPPPHFGNPQPQPRRAFRGNADPAQPPREVARGLPLVRRPSRTVPIVAAPLKEAKVRVSLPGAVHDVCVGGGGRFLILHLPDQRQLGVFDCNEAKIVKYLPLAEDNVLFAAGMTKLLVVLPDKNLIQRWDLTTLQREVTVPLPIPGKVCSVVMGSACDGALILGGPSLRAFGALPLCFIDVETLKEIEPADPRVRGGTVGTHREYPHTMRVSADGRTVTMWNPELNPMGLQSVVLNGTSIHTYYEHTTVGDILPGPDGRTLYTANGMFSSELRKIGNDQKNRVPIRLPAVQGDYFVSLGTPDSLRNPDGDAKPIDLAVHPAGDTRLLVTLSNVDGLDLSLDPFGRSRSGLSLDKRLFLLPAAKLIVTLPASGDKLYLQRLDLDEALEKSGVDYLLVSSQPVNAAVKGKSYAYPVVVKSKKGGVTFKLESAPQGMKISKDGRLTWDVPADFGEHEVMILLAVGDSSGQEIFHTFPITIKNKGEAGAALPGEPGPTAPSRD
jgi:predicted Zn finger-like uncharacterized protein